MMDVFRELFSKVKQGGSAHPAQDRVHNVHLAACALFLEMANIDDEFSESERQNIISILKEMCHISDENAFALIEAAKKEIEQSTDLWHFTKLIADHYSLAERVSIVEILWKIVYADGRLDKHENYLMHKVSTLLHLTHEELIGAKLRVLRAIQAVKAE